MAGFSKALRFRCHQASRSVIYGIFQQPGVPQRTFDLICQRLTAWRQPCRFGGAPRGWCAGCGPPAPLCAPGRPWPAEAQQRQRPNLLCAHLLWMAGSLQRSRQGLGPSHRRSLALGWDGHSHHEWSPCKFWTRVVERADSVKIPGARQHMYDTCRLSASLNHIRPAAARDDYQRRVCTS